MPAKVWGMRLQARRAALSSALQALLLDARKRLEDEVSRLQVREQPTPPPPRALKTQDEAL